MIIIELIKLILLIKLRFKIFMIYIKIDSKTILWGNLVLSKLINFSEYIHKKTIMFIDDINLAHHD